MKSLFVTISLLAATLIGLPTSGALAAKPKVLLKVATLAPDGSTWMKIMKEMDEEVREATGNGVGFKLYPNMVQGDEHVVLRRIRNGQLQGGGFTGTGLGAIASQIRVLELPFLFRGDEEVDLIHEQFDADFEAALAEKGFVLLGWAEVGPVYLFTNAPVRSPKDMSRVKMWIWEGDPVAESLFRAFDIPPIPLSIAHVMTSLQTGMVDGVYSSPYGCIALQWFTRTKHMTNVPVAHATGALVVSKKAFDKIPADQRSKVKAICRKHLDRVVQATRDENVAALTVIGDHGINRVEPDPSQLDSFRAQARKVWDELADDLYSRDLLTRITGALENHRAGRSSKVAETDE